MKDPDFLYLEIIQTFWKEICLEIFEYEQPYIDLNFPEKKGVSGYYSPNIKKTDIDIAKDFLNKKNIDVLNTRLFKD